MPAQEKGRSRDKAAALFNVSGRSVETAGKVLGVGSRPLIAAVEDGTVAVSDAATVLDRPAEEQTTLVEAVRQGEHRTLRRAALAHDRDARERAAEGLPARTDRYRLFTAAIAAVPDHLVPGSVDCILTDPPDPQEFLQVYGDLARTAARVLRQGGSCLVMAGQSYLPDILAAMTPHLRYHWTVACLISGGQSAQLRTRRINTFWEPVLWFVNAADGTGYAGDWVGDVVGSDPSNHDKRFLHWGPSESSMADLVLRFTQPGETILDPFLGAATTGVVALALDRLFIGTDQNPDAVTASLARLAAAGEGGQ